MGAAEGSRVGRQAVEEHLERRRAQGGSLELDADAYLRYVLDALFPLQHRLVRRLVVDKMRHGDFVAGARLNCQLG